MSRVSGLPFVRCHHQLLLQYCCCALVGPMHMISSTWGPDGAMAWEEEDQRA